MATQIQVEMLKTGLVLITLNRPERRNALSLAMLEELIEAMTSLQGTEGPRVLILQGAGPVFCSGLDLVEVSQPDLVRRSTDLLARTFQLMRDTDLVTIAAVHGAAYAGGGGLMASCDIAIAACDLKIGFPETRRGLLPALITAVMSPKVREGDLRELFLVGNTIDATRAQQIGLVQRIVPKDDLMKAALDLADGVLAGGPETVKAAKRLLNEAYSARESVSILRMAEAHIEARSNGEATEGM